MTGTSLWELAAAVRPGLEELGPVPFGVLAAQHGSQWALQLHERLTAVATGLVGDEAVVVFGGHFSSGKSTLINALFRQDILPTSDYPETGVPCWIRRGTANEAVVVGAEGHRSVALDTDAIAREVSLVDDVGDYRSHVTKLEELHLWLADVTVPGDRCCWVDSPGINDTVEMTARAEAAAAAADLLVWVINSQQALSEVEQAFLQEHVATRGNAALLLVVNAFLTDDSPADWERFLAERSGYYALRAEQTIDALVDGDGSRPPMHFMSARGALAQPEEFGAHELRELLRDLTPEHPLVRAARLVRAATTVRILLGEVRERLGAERECLAVAQDAWAKNAQLAASAREAFERDLRARVASCFARLNAGARECVSTVVREMDGVLKRDGSYGPDLRGRLTTLTTGLASELSRAAADCASRYGVPRQGATVERELTRLLTPGPIQIEVPNITPVKDQKAGGGATIGGILGFVIGGPVGAAAGAAIGGALGAGVSDDGVNAAIAKDRAGAKANALAAGEAAVTRLTGQQDRALAVLLNAHPAAVVPPPDGDRVAALEALTEWLDRHCLHPLTLAADAARNEVGA